MNLVINEYAEKVIARRDIFSTGLYRGSYIWQLKKGEPTP